MKSGIRKITSGKAMSVATVFTGAAASFAAFTPGAHAAAAGLMRPASIREASCNTVPKWVHLNDSINSSIECFGYDGVTAISFSTTSVCGGNNSGWLANSKGQETHFAAGDTYAKLPWPGGAIIRQISISNSQPKGHHAC
jgi:hypothetical protein